jgi:VWFA-related protein
MKTITSSQKRSLLTGAVMALAALMAAYPAAAQTVPGPIAPQPGQTVQKPPDRSQIRVRVNLVDTPAVVRDAKGELVLDLTEKNFRLFDNGKLQKIAAFDMGGAPLSVAIVLETSSRVEALLPAIRKTGIIFTQTVLGESGEAAVIGYNDEVDRLLDFTKDADAIDKAINDLQMGTTGARIYDALSQAVALLRAQPATRRKVIVALAEGEDTGSEAKLGQVLREAELANIVIYTVGLSSTAAALRNPPKQTAPVPITPPGIPSQPPIPGAMQTPTNEQLGAGNMDLGALAVWVVKHATEPVRDHPLEIAATATGGMYQSTFHDNSIEPAIDQIGGELHAQYVLSYRPTNTDAGGYHEIKVELVDRKGLKVRSRPGYYLGSDAN